MSWNLVDSLRPAVRPHGLLVFEAVNVRLRADRIAIPDVVVADTDDYVEDRVAKAGETLALTEPFRWALDPTTLR